MTKKPISLKWVIVLSVLSMGIILVIGYTILTAQYFVRGMDNIIAANMEAAALSFARTVPPGQRGQSNSFDGYLISSDWEQMPDDIRAGFGAPPQETGVLQKHDPSGFLEPRDVLYFLMRLRVDGSDLLITRTFTRASVSELVGRGVQRGMNTLLLIAGASAIALAIIIWLLMRFISQPVARLGSWARALGPDNLAEPTPDFVYPELNDLARLTKSSMASVLDSVERERQFLGHASHELRTPISVIRSNMALIRKLQQGGPEASDSRQDQALGRIDRASLTMKNLTETLLWLGREDTSSLPVHEVAIGELITQLVDESRYLLEDKNVRIEVSTDDTMIEVPEAASQIVLGNLIRNAFQHTWNGEVFIVQEGAAVRIQNRQTESSDDSHDATGFGLGLRLTEQLTRRLGWQYRSTSASTGRLVSIRLQRAGSQSLPDSKDLV